MNRKYAAALAVFLPWLMSTSTTLGQTHPDPSPTTIVLVRHAEKATNVEQDPPLTDAGHRRARAITELLADAQVTTGVDAVFASPYTRTQQTAQPLATAAGVEIVDYDPRDSVALATRVLEQHAGETVVIVGHSNTLPQLAAAFGAPDPLPPIDHDEYDNLYLLTIPPTPATAVGVVRLHLPGVRAPAPPSQAYLAAAQAWHLTGQHFVEANAVAGERWREAYARHLAPLPRQAKAPQASAAINAMLSDLNTSHTRHYTRADAAWYQLLGIFTHLFPELRTRLFPDARGQVTYTGLPMEIRYRDGRAFVGGFFQPLSIQGDAQLLVGDELLTVDGMPFDEVGVFSGKAGARVALSVRRQRGAAPLTVVVIPQALQPETMFLQAIGHSASISSDAGGIDIAYVRLWAYAGLAYHDRLRQLLAEPPFANAHGLVLDLRGGWGGADPSYADYFLSRTSTLEMTDRHGETTTFNDHWHKPLVVLVDEGTRSGKEVFAATLQAQGVPLVGSLTAGAVTGGRPFALLDDSLLYLAVTRVEVDGESLEGRGVMPDLPVPSTLAYAAGRDPQRERAMELARCLSATSEARDVCFSSRRR